jgi:hypothetical protein
VNQQILLYPSKDKEKVVYTVRKYSSPTGRIVFVTNAVKFCLCLFGCANGKKEQQLPIQDLNFQKVEACGRSRKSAHEGGKVVSRTDWPPLTPKKYSFYLWLSEAKSNAGP